MDRRVLFLALPLALMFAGIVLATVEITDNTNVAVPSDNGTSLNTSVAGRMQQYVGYYGNVSMQVRNNTNLGNVLYFKTVNFGRLFFVKTGATLTTPFTVAPTNAVTDANFSLTGYYNTSNHFDSTAVVCNLTNSNKLNTTDNRLTGIYYDAAAVPNYFFCTDIGSFTSSNGFGNELSYEIIVAKTATYIAYDIWFDLAA
ncbi:MAG: hypothetical protein V1787_06065 [Candidatus Micrarchaeota archaeon]